MSKLFDVEAKNCAGQADCQIADSVPKRRCLYDFLLRIADLVVISRSPAELFNAVAPLVQEITHCEFLDVALFDARQNRFTTQCWKRGRKGQDLKSRAADECASGWVWTRQQTLAVPDIMTEQRFPDCMEELRTHGVRSYMAWPMSTAVRRFGTLGLGKGEPQLLDPRDVEFVSRLARLAALALENQETVGAWQEQHERLQGLVSISRELSVSLDLEKLVPTLLSSLRRIMRHDHTVLSVLEEDEKTVRLYAVDVPEWEPFLVRDSLVPLEQVPSAKAIATRSVTILSGEDLGRMGPMANAMRESGIQSLCSVPLLSGSRAMGSLNLGSVRSNAFSQEDAEYLQQVASQIAAVLENTQAYREIAQLKDRLAHEKRYLESEIRSEMRLEEIVGHSSALKRVLESAAVVARTDSTVLITGETGTGKERIARLIHTMGRRRDRNFIKLNCAAIPTGLLESELFGHEKGAFTGAVSQKVGRLELADKGTLFLDEIGEIPQEIQPKLLRVLQDYEFERLGGTRTIKVDVRLIAATNRDLVRAVEEKQFRRDLFYRLHVFPLHLPALRERREDIPLLVRYFVDKCSLRLNRHIEIIPDEAIDAMLKEKWPGNIRELENFIERSVILSEGNVLRPPLAELKHETAVPEATPDDTLRSREREHIVQILRQTRGMLSGPSGAAARLGTKRTTLQYRMQKLGISRLDYLT